MVRLLLAVFLLPLATGFTVQKLALLVRIGLRVLLITIIAYVCGENLPCSHTMSTFS
jgi:hypothetical protein